LSEWSELLSFETGESEFSENLLINPDAEQGILGWSVTEGYMESLEAYVCDGIEPHSGDYYFIVGALCNTVSYSEAYQEVDISEYSDCIDQELAYANYGGYLSDWGGSDHPEMKIAFMDSDGDQILESETVGTYNAYWTLFSIHDPIPAGTRSIQMILMGTRYAGDDNDSYFDDLFLKIWQDDNFSTLLGDLNEDSNINILDVIIVVNLILEIEEYNQLADINDDDLINILDIIQLITIILNS
jgi:hypothetical protein